VIVRVVISAEASPPEMRFREFKEDPPEYGMAIKPSPICFVRCCFIG
jgi:hypothetical protein